MAPDHDAPDPLVLALKEHARAPRFNYEATDMLTPAFLDRVRAFERDMIAARTSVAAWRPVLARHLRSVLAGARRSTLALLDHDGPRGEDIVNADNSQLDELLRRLPTSKREDLARTPWRVMPFDVPLDDLLVYRTAGTTAEPMSVPSHPVAVGCYSPMLMEAMRRWDVHPRFTPDRVGIALIGCQETSVTVATRLQALENSGFVKLNVSPSEWRDPLDPYRYVSSIRPLVLTGDPFAFSELAYLGDRVMQAGEIDAPFSPACLITTAVALKAAVREHLQHAFHAPVIDLYSLTETGPIAYGCKAGHGYHVLPHDIHVEVLDEERRDTSGETGEITVSGGRNPYFPLIRYRTGDWGRLDTTPCECGDPMPLIRDLEGRVPVQYHTRRGKWVNDRDVSAVMGRFPVTRFTFHQDAAGDFHLVARLAPFDRRTTAGDLHDALDAVLGDGASIDVKLDATLGDRTRGKDIPFTTDFPLFYD